MNEGISNPRRTVLAVLALIAGGAVPIQLITLSFGYAQYARGIPKGPDLLPTAHAVAEWYVPFVYLPALALLTELWLTEEDRAWLLPFLFRSGHRGDRIGISTTSELGG